MSTIVIVLLHYVAHTYEAASLVHIEDFPQDAGPMWILGKEYDSKNDKYHIKKDVQSKLWITYRRGFTPIGELLKSLHNIVDLGFVVRSSTKSNTVRVRLGF